MDGRRSTPRLSNRPAARKIARTRVVALVVGRRLKLRGPVERSGVDVKARAAVYDTAPVATPARKYGLNCITFTYCVASVSHFSPTYAVRLRK